MGSVSSRRKDTKQASSPTDPSPISVESLGRHNSLLLIWQLPIELWISIFTISLEESRAKRANRYYQALHDIASVCTRFRDITLETPELWTLVDQTIPSSMLGTVLCNSGGYPISVTYGHSLALDPRYNKVIVQHVDRWQNLHIAFGDHLPPSLVSRPAPSLESLLLASAAQQAPLRLFAEHAPRLDYLRLIKVPLYWDSSIIRDLVVLELDNLTTFAPRVSELVTILHRCPRLQAFRVFQCGTTSEDMDVTRVSLPQLTRLELWNLFPETTLALVRVFHDLSSLEKLSVHCTADDGNSTTSVRECVRILAPSILTIMRKLLKLFIQVEDDSMRITSAHPRQFKAISEEDRFAIKVSILAIDYMDDILDSCITLILPPPESIPLLSLEFHFPDSFFRPVTTQILMNQRDRTILALLRDLQRVTHLRFSGQHNITSAVQYLGLRTINGPPETWPLPFLKTLKLVHCKAAPDELLAMIQHRYGYDEEEGGIAPNRVHPLESLSIVGNECATETTLKQIKHIIGEEKTQYHRRDRIA